MNSDETETVNRDPFSESDSQSAPLPSLIGTRIGSFTLRRIIGSGGMGTVYEAQQEQPRRRVAIKMMKPRKGEEPIAMREGLVLATVGSVADSPLIPRSTLTPP